MNHSELQSAGQSTDVAATVHRKVLSSPRVAWGCLLILGFSLIAGLNFPGQVPFDTTTALWEGRTHVRMSWGPPMFSAVLGVFDAILPGTALYAAASLLVLLVTWFVLPVLTTRMSWTGPALLALWLTVPHILIMQGILWRDVLFANLTVAGFVALAVAARLWRRPTLRFGVLAAAAVSLALAALVRQNGGVVIVAAAAALAWTARRGGWTRAMAWGAGGFACTLAIALTLTALDPVHEPPGKRSHTVGFVLLAHYDIAAALADEPARPLPRLESIHPAAVQALRAAAPKVFSPQRVDFFDRDPAMKSFWQFKRPLMLAAWRDLIGADPVGYARRRLSIFRWVFLTPDLAACAPLHLGVSGLPVVEHELGLRDGPYLQSARLWTYAQGWFATPFYSHLSYAGLATAVLVFLLVRRRPEDIPIAALMAGALLFAATFLVLSIACDYRYLYALDLAAITGSLYVAIDPSLHRRDEKLRRPLHGAFRSSLRFTWLRCRRSPQPARQFQRPFAARKIQSHLANFCARTCRRALRGDSNELQSGTISVSPFSANAMPPASRMALGVRVLAPRGVLTADSGGHPRRAPSASACEAETMEEVPPMIHDAPLSRLGGLRALAGSLPFPLNRCASWAGGTTYRLYHQVRLALSQPSQDNVTLPETQAAEAQTETVTETRTEAQDRARVSEFWAQSPEDRAASGGMNWLHHPLVARRVAIKAADCADSDTYVHLFQELRRAGWSFPVPRALSLGCGHGGLERGLMLHGAVERCDGIDLSEGAIEEARRRAAAAGMHQIHYNVGDLEHADFAEGAFDMVFFHHSMHHIEDLDALCVAVRRGLRPGGVLHLDDFVGPDRFQWTDAQLHHLNAFVQALPSRYRRLHTGDLMPAQVRPTIEQMIAFDPSEAVRSSAIMETVRRHFRVVEERELGGALLHIGLSGIAQNFDPEDPDDVAHLEAFFALEDRLMAEGVIGSDFVTVTAVRD